MGYFGRHLPQSGQSFGADQLFLGGAELVGGALFGLVEAGVLDRDGDLVAEDGEEFDIFGLEFAAGDLVGDQENAGEAGTGR